MFARTTDGIILKKDQIESVSITQIHSMSTVNPVQYTVAYTLLSGNVHYETVSSKAQAETRVMNFYAQLNGLN